jgi:hypothetical protein
MGGILYILAVLLIAFWVIGFFFAHIAAPVIHLLLVGAVVLFVIQLVSGGRTRVV